MGADPLSSFPKLLPPVLAVLALVAGCESVPAVRPPVIGWGFGLDRVDAPGTAIAGGALPSSNPAGATPGGPDGGGPATPPAPSTAPASGGSSGGSGGSGGAAAPTLAGEVRDEAELPVEGARVLFADGRSATTDASGRFSVSGSFSAGPVVVSKAGYATSAALDLDGLPTLHLRRADGRTDDYIQRTVTVSGAVSWPAADSAGVAVTPNGGVVYYQDSLGSLSAPSYIAANGQFAITLETQRDGEPVGVVLVLAGDQTGQRTLMGVSRPFKPLSNEEPGLVPVAVADKSLAYAGTGAPSGLTTYSSQLEVVQDGVPSMVLLGDASLNGTFQAPPPGTLPGTLRVRVEARDAGTRSSAVSMVPGYDVVAGTFQAATAAFLDPPAVTVGAGGAIGWTAVAGAAGYRASVTATGEGAAQWEAWTIAGTSATVPASDMPASGVAMVEAVDAPGLTGRSVASLRQLRVAPWTGASTYRVASRKVSL